MSKFIERKKYIYLDYAAATPLDARVKRAMEPFFSKNFGNPSSLHSLGEKAKAALNASRKTIAGIISARPEEIIFTAGGTESVNLAIFGAARHLAYPAKKKYHLVASAVEHECVLNSFRALAGEGFKTTLVKVDREGFVSLESLKKAIRSETILISVMYANNEIGTVEPIAEIGKWLKAENLKRQKQGLPAILFHTDACQAAGYLDLNVQHLGVDLMSVNGGKIYGPKQTGFLFVRSGVNLKPLVYGGGQEGNLRSGTENVAGAVGLAAALEIAQKEKSRETGRLTSLRNYFINEIISNNKGILLNGPGNSELKGYDKRLPNNINLSFSEANGEDLVIYLDAYGIEASSASACGSQSGETSHVLKAIGLNETQAKNSLRLTLGKFTNKKDLNFVLKVLQNTLAELKKTSKIK